MTELLCPLLLVMDRDAVLPNVRGLRVLIEELLRQLLLVVARKTHARFRDDRGLRTLTSDALHQLLLVAAREVRSVLLNERRLRKRMTELLRWGLMGTAREVCAMLCDDGGLQNLMQAPVRHMLVLQNLLGLSSVEPGKPGFC